MSTQLVTRPISQDGNAPAITKLRGAFLIPPIQQPKPKEFTVYSTLGGFARSDGGPITTIYGKCCSSCRHPHLSQRYILTTDPETIADEYTHLKAQNKLYICPACGGSKIKPPHQSGDTYHCAYCDSIIELANVRGSAMSRAHDERLRAMSTSRDERDWLCKDKKPTVSIKCWWYVVEMNGEVHNVGKNKQCTCPKGAHCSAVKAVADYLRAGGKRAPEPPCLKQKARLQCA